MVEHLRHYVSIHTETALWMIVTLRAPYDVTQTKAATRRSSQALRP